MEKGDLVLNGQIGNFSRAVPALVIAVKDSDIEIYQPGHCPNREWRPLSVIMALSDERATQLADTLNGLLEKWAPWNDRQLGPLAEVREAARIAVRGH